MTGKAIAFDGRLLAELLTDLGPGRKAIDGWARALKSYNCAALPGSEVEMPAALQYAGSANLLLAELKLQDRAADSRGRSVNAAFKVYSAPFLDAARWLTERGLDVRALRSEAEMQPGYEAALAATASLANLEACAVPTAEMTASVFEAGASACRISPDTADQLNQFGRAFGRLVYFIDACEDITRDARRGEFNAFAAAFPTLEKDALQAQAVEFTRAALDNTIEALAALPLARYAFRRAEQMLVGNTARKIGVPSAEPACCVSANKSEKLPRFKTAIDTAKRLTSQHRAECAGAVGAIKSPFVFAAVAAVALLFPAQAAVSNSVKECVGLLFSLLLWGSAANAAAQAMVRAVSAPVAFAGNIPARFMARGRISSSSSRGTETIVTTTRVRTGPPCCQICACECCADCCSDCACQCCICESIDCAACLCDSCACG